MIIFPDHVLQNQNARDGNRRSMSFVLRAPRSSEGWNSWRRSSSAKTAPLARVDVVDEETATHTAHAADVVEVKTAAHTETIGYRTLKGSVIALNSSRLPNGRATRCSLTSPRSSVDCAAHADRLAFWKGSPRAALGTWVEWILDREYPIRCWPKFLLKTQRESVMCWNLLVFDRDRTCTFYTVHTTLPKWLRGLLETNWKMLVLVLLPNLELTVTVWRYVAFTHRPETCLTSVLVIRLGRRSLVTRKVRWSCMMR